MGENLVWRVLVGGSNHGRAYFEAMALEGSRYQPAGLLARGSLRSRELAAAHGIPLFTSVAAAKGCADLACLALPPAPMEALELLRSGVPVLCEHPQTAEFLESAFAAADAGGTVFQLNGHFSRLPASTAFLAHARLRMMQSKVRFAMVTATDRSLFAAVDILASTLGPPDCFSPGRREKTARSPEAFASFEMEWNGAEVYWLIQRRGPEDGSAEYLVDYRIAIGFPEGVLTLLSLGGPVIWNDNYARLGDAAWTSVYTGANVREQRARANLAAMDGLREANHSREYLVAVARLWHSLGKLL